MLKLTVALVVSLLIAAGCSDEKNPVREYGTTLTGAVKKAEKTKNSADKHTEQARDTGE